MLPTNRVSACPHCGAPIYQAAWDGQGEPPECKFSCACRLARFAMPTVQPSPMYPWPPAPMPPQPTIGDPPPWVPGPGVLPFTPFGPNRDITICGGGVPQPFVGGVFVLGAPAQNATVASS